MRFGAFLLFALGGAALAACGGGATVQGPREDLPPAHVLVEEGAGGRTVRILDTDQLLAEANAQYDRGRFAEAAAAYDRLLAADPDPPLLRTVLFNAGLAREGLREHDAATAHYERLLALAPAPKLALDTRFRLAGCHAGSEAWSEAERVWTDVLATPLTPPDEVAAHTKRGIARQRQERFAEAEQDYRAALAVYQEHTDHRRLRGLADVSIAQYQIGEIYRILFERIAFQLPLERMERAVDEKATLFLKSQHAYLDAVRLPNRHWGVAAGYQIGHLFETMYFDMLRAEVPDDMDEESRQIYQDELRRVIRPYVVRAVELYETNLAASMRFGAEGEWVQKTREHLVRLRELLRETGETGAESP